MAKSSSSSTSNCESDVVKNGVEIACQTEPGIPQPSIVTFKKLGRTWFNRILSYSIPILLFNTLFIFFVKYFLDSNHLELWVHDKLGNYY